MPGVDGLSFKTLRTWNGEQSRAFEELSYQLLKDRGPAGTRAIRTGNPDGGVEWYAPLPDGTEWGWQAKHVEGIDALLTAMTDSVKRVAKERTNLRKLTFAISWNLATGTSGGKRTSQRQKYENKVKTWKQTIPGADRIHFELVQESDLLDELAKPEHNGRRWFWWDQVVLSRDWLKQRQQEQADAAGEKYRPDLQVDIPIQEDLLALGFDESVLSAFNRLRRDVVTAVGELHLTPRNQDEPGATLYQAIHDTAVALQTTASALALQAGDPPAALEPLTHQLSACAEAIGTARDYERRLAAEWRELPGEDPKKAQKPPEHADGYGVGVLRTAIDELDSWLESPTGRAFRRRTYFLTGQAGSGKTHLLLDASQRALIAGRPAVFLAGAQFGKGDLWASITDQLGLQPVGADVLLRAMDAAGEAASPFGSRFVIFIDALNETMPADFWRTYLPRLRAAVARHPHVALVVSCRDTYRDLVLEGNEGNHYVRRAHPGFAEREVEATQRYFEHYGLEAPKIPLLTPEFTLPLFLRLYCESLSQADVDSIPTGHQGRVVIFERYLGAKISAVARRLRPGASSSYELEAAKAQVRRTLNALLDELSRLGRESMSATAADEVVRSSLEGSGVDSARLMGLLQEEGVLTRERLYLGGGITDEGIRIVFQAFADFLLLKRRLALSEDPLSDEAVRSWLTEDSSWGINEAATILFPEVHGVELPDLLGIKMADEPDWSEDRAAWDLHQRAHQLYRSLVETLPYRASEAITQRTIDLLNEAQPYLSRTELYGVLFALAPQPGNRLNGEGLHRYLLQRKMPERDRDFGVAMYHELSDSSGTATRLARWATGGPYPAYDAEVIELACIPLCWLLSSPNRFMRDWITKALVQLLRGHLNVVRALVERFWTVDDPYVVQRVVVIAYGSVLRSSPQQADHAKAIAELVHTLVFTQPVRPDELLLDAARGIVRWAEARQLLPASALDSSRRPYGLKVPGQPPTEVTLKAKYGWREGQPHHESYSSIYFSLMGMGDFARYVVQPGVHHFSRYRIGQAYAEDQRREPRFVKARWETFIASLTDEQEVALAIWLRNPEEQAMSPLRFLLQHEEDPLTEEQRKLWDAVYVYPKPVVHEYPADVACRWIFRRAISLGWTPKLFGEEDRRIGHGRGREGHKAERWGKKYQWIAYHELLSRVADNYQASRRFGDSESYDGLHQIIGDREIDPSLPPIEYRIFNEDGGGGATAWSQPQISLQEWPPAPLTFNRYQGDVNKFLSDTDSEPTVARSMFVLDRDGSEWVVLESFVKKVDPLADKGWRGLQECSTIDTLLIKAGSSEAFLATLTDKPRHSVRDLVDSHGHTDCCYMGEVGRAGPSCPHRHDALRPVSIGGRSFEVVPTVEQYTWEGSILDCSIDESATAVLPSTFIQQAARLNVDMRGPSWLDATGTPMFTYYEEQGNDSRAFMVRKSFIQHFLVTHQLELIALHWYERMQLSSDYHRGKHPLVESTTNARLTAALNIYPSASMRMERDLD
ncbi:hypothetical protein [Streptomyces sp. ISL-86]|uniref:hypothetical protein n=1 Tax=Streptomyces sp. ISL-86 TaxID=2819187 RepID=UPI001BE91212|nr:hypothetical protein [Streptomyces sp. ISL-86]MBT2455331.1 hypothetical protein [Streptomyces sp. ISL-86]